MLNLERLRVLQAVARHGSVTAAAAELHVTTSAVSQQLTKLERESGAALVERSGRGIRLTEAAQLLASHASAILSMAELAQADVDARAGAVAGADAGESAHGDARARGASDAAPRSQASGAAA